MHGVPHISLSIISIIKSTLIRLESASNPRKLVLALMKEISTLVGGSTCIHLPSLFHQCTHVQTPTHRHKYKPHMAQRNCQGHWARQLPWDWVDTLWSSGCSNRLWHSWSLIKSFDFSTLRFSQLSVPICLFSLLFCSSKKSYEMFLCLEDDDESIEITIQKEAISKSKKINKCRWRYSQIS